MEETTQPINTKQNQLLKKFKDLKSRVKMPNFAKKFVRRIPRQMQIALLVLGGIFILVIITGLLFGRRSMDEKVTREVVVPTGTTQFPFFDITNPSAYATDPDILNLEQEISVLDKEINEVDLKESLLQPPSLDFDIDFEEK